TELFEAYQLTLREQVHCCSLLSLSIRTTPSNNKLFPLFLCLLIVLKVKEPEVYKRFISGELTPNQLIEKIKQTDRLNGIFESSYGAVLEAYIAACRKYDYTGEDITAPYVRIRDSLDSQDTEKHYANRVLQILEQFEWSGGFGSLDYLVKKIEVASRFNA
ncbi:hypothetical protein NMR29_003672, partial [Vibrio cholerae]|nr:hypothetical protein [Vibrio cholerae]